MKAFCPMRGILLPMGIPPRPLQNLLEYLFPSLPLAPCLGGKGRHSPPLCPLLVHYWDGCEAHFAAPPASTTFPLLISNNQVSSFLMLAFGIRCLGPTLSWGSVFHGTVNGRMPLVLTEDPSFARPPPTKHLICLNFHYISLKNCTCILQKGNSSPSM